MNHKPTCQMGVSGVSSWGTPMAMEIQQITVSHYSPVLTIIHHYWSPLTMSNSQRVYHRILVPSKSIQNPNLPSRQQTRPRWRKRCSHGSRCPASPAAEMGGVHTSRNEEFTKSGCSWNEGDEIQDAINGNWSLPWINWNQNDENGEDLCNLIQLERK